MTDPGRFRKQGAVGNYPEVIHALARGAHEPIGGSIERQHDFPELYERFRAPSGVVRASRWPIHGRERNLGAERARVPPSGLTWIGAVEVKVKSIDHQRSMMARSSTISANALGLSIRLLS